MLLLWSDLGDLDERAYEIMQQVLLEARGPLDHVLLRGLDEQVGRAQLAALRAEDEAAAEQAIGALAGLEHDDPVLGPLLTVPG